MGNTSHVFLDGRATAEADRLAVLLTLQGGKTVSRTEAIRRAVRDMTQQLETEGNTDDPQPD